MTVVTGKSYWAKLNQAENKFDPAKPRWSIDVALNKEGVKFVKGLGIPVKNKNDDRGDFMTTYKNKFKQDGTELPKPKLIDSQKNDISGILIGNGSDVRVSFNINEYSMNGNKGKRANLNGVQVIKLVEYSPPDEFEVEDGGYVGASTDVPFDADPPSSTEDSDLDFE